MRSKRACGFFVACCLELACSVQPPALNSSIQFSLTSPLSAPTYSAASIALNGASQPAPISPGSLISIYGQNLGPIKPCTSPTGSLVPSTQIFPNKLCDVEVQIGGLAAGLLYVSSNQINCKIPQNLPTNVPTVIHVQYKDLTGPSVSIPLAPPISPETVKQTAEKMWAGLQNVKWRRIYNTASDKCAHVLPQQIRKNGLQGQAYYCEQHDSDVTVESFYYPVDHASPKLRLLRSDIRPVFAYPEKSVAVENLLIEKLTKEFGPPSVPGQLYELGLTRQQPGLSWHTGSHTIFLHHNLNHAEPSGVRNGVILITIDDTLLNLHKRVLRLEDEFGSRSQSTLLSDLSKQFPEFDLTLSSPHPNSETDRAQAEQQTSQSLLRMLGHAQAVPEKSAAALVAADQLARRLAQLLVKRSIVNGSEILVVSSSAPKLNSMLATYGVHFGTIGHYSGDLDYDYNLLARAAKEFPATIWGQRAFLLLQQLGCATTRSGCSSPNCFLAVIQQGENFLDTFPASPYRIQQTYNMAQAYETWWSLGQAKHGDITAEGALVSKSSAENARQHSIQLYESLLQLAPASPEAQAAQLALPLLKLMLDPNQRTYFCFSC